MALPGQLRDIVNGALLSQYNGKPVSLTGIVTDVDSNGNSFEMRTVDNMSVTVNLSSPLDDILDGYVEVHGIARGKNQVNAEEYIQFTMEQFTDFDIDGHNKLCTLLMQVPDPYRTS